MQVFIFVLVRWCAGAVVRLSDKKSMSDICLLFYFSLTLEARKVRKWQLGIPEDYGLFKMNYGQIQQKSSHQESPK